MRRWNLVGGAVALALLVWAPLGIAGVPLDTPDGFLHLGWSVAWARQLQAGWLWPTWSDLPWAGAGSFALLIYPPLFRVISGLPMLIGIPPDHAMASGVLVILLVNALGAATLARAWLRPGGWRWLLVLAASFNPYLWVNIYVRGAVASLGADCVEKEMTAADREKVAALLARAGISADAASFRRYGSARTLYNFHVDHADSY